VANFIVIFIASGKTIPWLRIRVSDIENQKGGAPFRNRNQAINTLGKRSQRANIGANHFAIQDVTEEKRGQ
jgi:hypothetical protein